MNHLWETFFNFLSLGPSVFPQSFVLSFLFASFLGVLYRAKKPYVCR
jgi:hypothetical protein